jgi:hypothetical protein
MPSNVIPPPGPDVRWREIFWAPRWQKMLFGVMCLVTVLLGWMHG